MSSLNRLIIAPDAKKDIAGILQYTEEVWGIAQKDRYAGLIYDAFLTLQSYPLLGYVLHDFSEELRAYPVGKHFLMYQVTEEVVYILRILHENMDVSRHL